MTALGAKECSTSAGCSRDCYKRTHIAKEPELIALGFLQAWDSDSG